MTQETGAATIIDRRLGWGHTDGSDERVKDESENFPDQTDKELDKRLPRLYVDAGEPQEVYGGVPAFVCKFTDTAPVVTEIRPEGLYNIIVDDINTKTEVFALYKNIGTELVVNEAGGTKVVWEDVLVEHNLVVDHGNPEVSAPEGDYYFDLDGPGYLYQYIDGSWGDGFAEGSVPQSLEISLEQISDAIGSPTGYGRGSLLVIVPGLEATGTNVPRLYINKGTADLPFWNPFA